MRHANDRHDHIVCTFNSSLFECLFVRIMLGCSFSAFQLQSHTQQQPQVTAHSFMQGRRDELMDLRCISASLAAAPKPHPATPRHKQYSLSHWKWLFQSAIHIGNCKVQSVPLSLAHCLGMA